MYVAVIAKFEQLQTTEPQPVNQYTGTEFERSSNISKMATEVTTLS